LTKTTRTLSSRLSPASSPNTATSSVPSRRTGSQWRLAELDPDRACNPLVWRLSLEGFRQIAHEMLGQPTEPADIDADIDADRVRVQGEALLRHAEALEAWARSPP
jgi:hypothetical protein